MKRIVTLIFLLAFAGFASAQNVKILFDASKGETAGNADWVIDADQHNLGFPSSNNGAATLSAGNESNAQRFPAPAQSSIIASTIETYWNGALSYWGIDCVKKNYAVETLPYNGAITYGNAANAQDLSNYTVFIVCEPNILFTATEKTAMMNFVQNGGGLFMISDHDGSDRNGDGYDSPTIWNDFMTNNGVQSNPFGMTFDLADFSHTSSNVSTLSADSLLHGPMGNVTKVQWSGGTTLTIQPSVNASVKASVCKTGTFGNSNVMVAYARYGNGKVVAIGDSSPCDDGSGDNNDQLYDGYIADAAGNHQKLLMNATIWLATNGSTLAVTVTDFNVTATENKAIIHWQNLTESGIREYDVQSSQNGSAFETITVLSPIKNNSTKVVYSYVDVSATASSKKYYRLKIVELNGFITYTPIKEVEFKHNGFTVSILNNPVSNLANIKLTIDDAMPISIVVLNALGKKEASFKFNCSKGMQTLHLPVSALAKGDYYLSIKSAQGEKVVSFLKN